MDGLTQNDIYEMSTEELLALHKELETKYREMGIPHGHDAQRAHTRLRDQIIRVHKELTNMRMVPPERIDR